MKAKELYSKLDKDFGIEKLKDNWSYMNFNDFITSGFKKTYMGLVLDNTDEVEKVYTATMPDLNILDKLFLTNQTDILLFSHHAMGYNPAIPGIPFYDIPLDYLIELKQRRISFYVLHVPPDLNGEYSTAVNLAKYLNLEIIGEFCEWEGNKVGVSSTEIRTATSMTKYVGSVVGHYVKLILMVMIPYAMGS